MHANILEKLRMKAYICDIFVTTSHKKIKIKIFKNEFKTSIFYAEHDVLRA